MNLMIQAVAVAFVIFWGISQGYKLPLIWLCLYLTEGIVVQLANVVTMSTSFSLASFIAELLILYGLIRHFYINPPLPKRYTRLIWIFLCLALLLSIRNHPIIDGNKRTGLFVKLVFS